MNKIVGFLFTLLLFVGMFYGLVYLRGENLYSLVFEDKTYLELGFHDDMEAYDAFLSLAEEAELTVSRVVYPDNNTMIIYTTDVTLGGRVQLLEGELPPAGTSYFISTMDMEDDNQIGVMVEIIPELNIMIEDLQSSRNFGMDGRFLINTIDSEMVRFFVYSLQAEIYYARIIDDIIPNRLLRRLLHFNPQGISSIGHLILEFVSIFPALALCLFLALMQYVLNLLKSNIILLTHGYSKIKVAKMNSKMLISIWLIATLISYFGIVLYLIVTEQASILVDLTLFLMVFTVSLILIGLVVINIVFLICLQLIYDTSILKGRKTDSKIQVLNHAAKLIFTAIFMFLAMTTWANLVDVRARLAASYYWGKAENVYQISVNAGGSLDYDYFIRHDERKAAFYYDLMRYHQGFMMDSVNIRIIDILHDEQDEWAASDWYDLHLVDRVENVRVSPGFLKINPIYTVEGELAFDALILDSNTLNVLIPERMGLKRNEIYEMLLEDYSTADRVNVIDVHDDQYYFMFNSRQRVNDSNRILDPFAIIYYEQVLSESYIASLLTHSVYFLAETYNPFAEIEPLIHAHDLGAQIHRVEALYDDNMREIRVLQSHQARLRGILVLLVISNVSVVYNLIANYFERHKFEIFLRGTYGWHFFKQNKELLITYFAYSLPLVLLMAYLLGFHFLFIGMTILALDILAILLFQRSLMKKSFSEIMKGER